MSKKMVAVLGVVAIAVAAAVGVMATQSAKNDEPAEMAVSQPASEDAASIEPAAAVADAKADEKAPAKVASADDPVVAKVDGDTILRSDVIEFMQNLPPQMKQLPPETIFPMALEQVINGKIVENKAEKTDVASDPEVAKRMDQAKEQITRAVYVEKEIEKNLSADRVKKAYDKIVAEQGKVEEVKARHILVEKESEAKDIIKKLADGAKFEDLAKEMSKDTANKATGGDLGYFTKDSMVKEFADAAFSMKKGETSKEPVKTQFGYHVIQVEDRRNRPAPDFETVKPQVEAQERRAILTELLESWRKKADVETFDMNGKPVEAAAKPGDVKKAE